MKGKYSDWEDSDGGKKDREKKKKSRWMLMEKNGEKLVKKNVKC